MQTDCYWFARLLLQEKMAKKTNDDNCCCGFTLTWQKNCKPSMNLDKSPDPRFLMFIFFSPTKFYFNLLKPVNIWSHLNISLMKSKRSIHFGIDSTKKTRKWIPYDLKMCIYIKLSNLKIQLYLIFKHCYLFLLWYLTAS